MKRSIILAAATALVGLFAGQTHAIVDPGFEDANLRAWNPIGYAETSQVFKGVVPPTQGFQQATLYTDRFPVQRNNPAASAIRLSNALGVNVGNALGGRFIRNGSAIQQSVDLAVPTNLVFDWAFAHRVDEPSGNDIAFVLIDEQAFILTDLVSAPFIRLGDNNFAATNYFTAVDLPTLEPGVHDIAFGIVAVDYPDGRSALLVDNVRLIPDVPFFVDPTDPTFGNDDDGGIIITASANPEPATAALVALGLAATTFATHRRCRAA